MAPSVILSCPFCHQKGEYRDAPPNSTVRCQGCSSVFRVPANAYQKHRPGTVLKGEEAAKRGMHRYLKIALLVLFIAGAGAYLWFRLTPGPVVGGDPFATVAKAAEGTADGAIERFLLAWKAGDTELMLRYCRPGDREKLSDASDEVQRESFHEWVKSSFETVRLKSYNIKKWRPDGERSREYFVDVEGEDARSQGALAGGLTKRGGLELYVVRDAVQVDGVTRDVWGVDIQTAAPKWQD